MKAFFLLLLTWSLNVSAETKCSQNELSGLIKRNGPDIILVSAPKSLSEKTYKFGLTTRGNVLPYINQYVSGVFILKGDDQIVKASSIKDAVYDPVSGEKNPSSKKLKDVPCPQ